MKVTKLEAAGMQLDAAIEHFLRGELVPAIHCAGAAEELCGRYAEKHGGKTMPDGMWEEFDFTDLVANKKEFIATINMFRDWVKHTHETHADTMEIEDWQAYYSLQRAALAYMRLMDRKAVPPRRSIMHLGKWHEANKARIEAILGLEPED
jgi:hypothetical protein